MSSYDVVESQGTVKNVSGSEKTETAAKRNSPPLDPAESKAVSSYDVNESVGTVKNAGSIEKIETPTQRPLQFHPVTAGRNVLIRAWDSQGGGLPGAARTRDGRLVPGGHKGGVDICIHPHNQVLAPIDGTIQLIHPHDALLPGIRINGTGAWKGYQVKLFHVRPYSLSQVSAGDPVGTAVDLTNAMPGIQNHVHVQATQSGQQVNTMHMFGWFSGVSKSSWTVER